MLFEVDSQLTWFAGRIKKWYPEHKRGPEDYNYEVEYSDGRVDQSLMAHAWIGPAALDPVCTELVAGQRVALGP